MCGIVGYISTSPAKGGVAELLAMSRTLRRRGPDDEGYVLINSTNDEHQNLSGEESEKEFRRLYPGIEKHHSEFAHNIALGHRRYSIVDIGPSGHQPMWDATGKACISFYGEIYNYVELRQELVTAGVFFRTRSDTEVILQAYLKWGTAAFQRFNGPFSFVLYDRRIRKLLLCRDRIGKASFYYTIRNNRLYWATEIKSFLKVFGAAEFTVRDQAVEDFVCLGLRDFDGTFWNEIHDFPPASFAWVQDAPALKTEQYWALPESRLRQNRIEVGDTVDEFRSILVDAIRIRLRADVSVAFELSGGLDSSAIVGLAATDLSERVTAYTVKHTQKHSDEEPYARAVAEMHPEKIDHRIFVPEQDDFWGAADRIFWTLEEPFHSPNVQTNQDLRRVIQRDGFRAVITGAAGDEVLAGYAGDYNTAFLRHLMNEGHLISFFNELIKNTEGAPLRSARRFASELMRSNSVWSAVRKPKTDMPEEIASIFSLGSETIQRRREDNSFTSIMRDNMSAWKMNYWLRSGPKAMFDIPIEPRSPFQDYRLIDFAFKLPPELLIHDGWHKWILRQATKDVLPEEVIWRRQKMGFPFPIREWLQNSKPTLVRNLSGVDCPYVNTKQLISSYDELVTNGPDVLWRICSVVLWWRKVILGRSVVQLEPTATRYAS